MQVRLGFYIVLLASIVGAVGFLLWRENSRATELESLRQFKTQAETDISTLKQQGELLDKLIAEKVQKEVARRQQRAVINQALEEASREEPVVRDYLNEPLPDGVRAAYSRKGDSAQPAGTD